jgi:hypothetical protein
MFPYSSEIFSELIIYHVKNIILYLQSQFENFSFFEKNSAKIITKITKCIKFEIFFQKFCCIFRIGNKFPREILEIICQISIFLIIFLKTYKFFFNFINKISRKMFNLKFCDFQNSHDLGPPKVLVCTCLRIGLFKNAEFTG